METKQVEINAENAPLAPEEFHGTYSVRRWNWYEKQQASSYATTIIDETRGIAEWSVPDWYTAMMKTCVTPPEALREEWNEDLIMKLDPDIGDLLRDACVAVTGVDKKGFLERSKQEKDTPI